PSLWFYLLCLPCTRRRKIWYWCLPAPYFPSRQVPLRPLRPVSSRVAGLSRRRRCYLASTAVLSAPMSESLLVTPSLFFASRDSKSISSLRCHDLNRTPPFDHQVTKPGTTNSRR